MAKELKNILINYIFESNFRLLAEKHLTGKMADIGCGEKPYQKILQTYITEHVGIDHIQTQHSKTHIDLIANAYSVPVPDETFDSAICTAVLEHLEEPGQAIQECYRILRKGGTAIYSAPFIWHLHEEPRDFFRYSKYGLSYLFEKAGFKIIDIKPLSGFWVTFGQLFVYWLYRFNKGIIKFIPIIPIVGIIVQLISFILDKLDIKSEKWTWMYIVVVEKEL